MWYNKSCKFNCARRPAMMNDEIKRLLDRAINCKADKELRQMLRTMLEILERRIQADDESRAFQERTAEQPFEGANPVLRHYPRQNGL